MMKRILVAVMIILSLGPTWLAAEEETPPVNIEGRWIFRMESSLRRKSVVITLEQKEDRLYGFLLDSQYDKPKVGGRVEGNKVLIWSRHVNKIGGSKEATFRGVLEGEEIKGEVDYFRKRMDFTAVRSPQEEE